MWKWPPNGKLLGTVHFALPDSPVSSPAADRLPIRGTRACCDWLKSSASGDRDKNSPNALPWTRTSLGDSASRDRRLEPGRPRLPRALPSSTSHPRTGERSAHLRPARPPPSRIVSRRKFLPAALSRKWRRRRRERRRRRRPRPDLGRRPPRDAWPHDPGQRPRRRSRGASASGPARPDGPPTGPGGPPPRSAVGTRRRGGASRAAPRAR